MFELEDGVVGEGAGSAGEVDGPPVRVPALRLALALQQVLYKLPPGGHHSRPLQNEGKALNRWAPGIFWLYT